jgi:hypothetical protein
METVEGIEASKRERQRMSWRRALRAAMAWVIDELIWGFAAYGCAMHPTDVNSLRPDAARENFTENPR